MDVQRLRLRIVLPCIIGALSVNAGPASIAGGTVRNRLDEPVAGATVTVIRVRSVDNQTKFDELAKGVTDDSGRFSIAAVTNPDDDIGLEVHAPGFMLWRRWAGGTDEDESIVLNRVIDDAYFADVEREYDPQRRLSLVLDLVGARSFNSYAFDARIEQYYSHLGAIRDDLLAIAQSKPFAVADDAYGESPAQRAKNLLIYWFDPRDESLIRKWAKEEEFKRFHLDVATSGDSPAEVTSAYATAHFAHEPKTFYYFTNPVFSPDCKHAYVVFVVRYAHWGYWQPLVLLEKSGVWRVRLVGEGGRWHGLSPEEPGMVYPE